jgi:hypothetical protein
MLGRAHFRGGPDFRLNMIRILALWPQDELNRTISALDKDLFTIMPEEIATDKVLLTLFAGKEPYRDPSLSARLPPARVP